MKKSHETLSSTLRFHVKCQAWWYLLILTVWEAGTGGSLGSLTIQFSQLESSRPVRDLSQRRWHS